MRTVCFCAEVLFCDFLPLCDETSSGVHHLLPPAVPHSNLQKQAVVRGGYTLHHVHRLLQFERKAATLAGATNEGNAHAEEVHEAREGEALELGGHQRKEPLALLLRTKEVLGGEGPASQVFGSD